MNIEYTAGGTNTFLALDLVASRVLTPEGGARQEVARVVIVITDGMSSDAAKTKDWAYKLKKDGAYVFAIGQFPSVFAIGQFPFVFAIGQFPFVS